MIQNQKTTSGNLLSHSALLRPCFLYLNFSAKQFLHPALSTKKILTTKKGICKLYDFCLAKDAPHVAKIKMSKVSKNNVVGLMRKLLFVIKDTKM